MCKLKCACTDTTEHTHKHARVSTLQQLHFFMEINIPAQILKQTGNGTQWLTSLNKCKIKRFFQRVHYI